MTRVACAQTAAAMLSLFSCSNTACTMRVMSSSEIEPENVPVEAVPVAGDSDMTGSDPVAMAEP